MEYEINRDTFIIIPIDSDKSRIIEKANVYNVESSTFKVVEHSCEYFGSSYNGRFFGTKNILNITHKSPIIIEETSNMIFFPTASPTNPKCCWVSLNNILNYMPGKNPKTSIIEFIDGSKIELNISIGILNNQILRSTRLQVLFNKRIKEKL